ncbi:hypothetical protein GHK28_06790 [Sinorhizobium medicae]|nr:hypothetical protein [Sinorhizobium medicae]MQV46326.1 hypothetical protein [Sinorhizobium medicae]MQV54057.1 hypothetical protein [Sinorhizobium medicae]MQV71696.1 hypothetical protein [Sinorhizobium medicae]
MYQAPRSTEDRSSRPKTSPRRTPERNCLAAPPAADGQTSRPKPACGQPWSTGSSSGVEIILERNQYEG